MPNHIAFAAGTAVVDGAFPGIRAKIITAGSEQSEVIYDGGRMRSRPNACLHKADEARIEAPIDELCQHNPSPDLETVRLGQEAMARKRRAWEDWVAIAKAIQIGRAAVMMSFTLMSRGASATKRRSAIGWSPTRLRRSTRARGAGCSIASNTSSRSRSGALG